MELLHRVAVQKDRAVVVSHDDGCTEYGDRILSMETGLLVKVGSWAGNDATQMEPDGACRTAHQQPDHRNEPADLLVDPAPACCPLRASASAGYGCGQNGPDAVRRAGQWASR